VQRALGIKGFVVHRQNYDCEVWKLIPQGLHQFQARFIFKRDIDQNHVWSAALNGRDCAGRILRVAANVHVSLLVDEIGQAFANEWMIVNDKDPMITDAATRVLWFHGDGWIPLHLIYM